MSYVDTSIDPCGTVFFSTLHELCVNFFLAATLQIHATIALRHQLDKKKKFRAHKPKEKKKNTEKMCWRLLSMAVYVRELAFSF